MNDYHTKYHDNSHHHSHSSHFNVWWWFAVYADSGASWEVKCDQGGVSYPQGIGNYHHHHHHHHHHHQYCNMIIIISILIPHHHFDNDRIRRLHCSTTIPPLPGDSQLRLPIGGVCLNRKSKGGHPLIIAWCRLLYQVSITQKYQQVLKGTKCTTKY